MSLLAKFLRTIGGLTSAKPTLSTMGSGIYWMVTVNVAVWLVAPLVAVTVRG
jgi:hypothetical protein